MAQDEVNAVAAIVRRKLDQARDQLVDRNLRNKLVNCPLTSKRSKQIRVVDELPDEVFTTLLGQKREFTFAAGRGLQEEPGQEDLEYSDWTPPESDEADERGVARRHRDTVLQTQLTAEGLQKRLTSLFYESKDVEEEQGVNVLYLALGFLKWFEDARSEVERYAPLVLVPVELTRQGAKERFRIKARDEELITNVSLKLWLSEQHAIQLPELPDTDEWIPSKYFQQVREAIAKAPRWEVQENEILLGFFSFSKFLLWRDLDPRNWPTPDGLLGHSVLRTLLAPQEENPTPDPPVIPNDRRVDDLFKSADLTYVLDADSSQTAAIETAIAGRNLVIQGPPGTGKSQTIANIIAAAINRGKSVLFVAEKLAALQVVYDRLKSVGLGPLCLELHSRKASKQQVLAQLREAIEAPAPPKVSDDLCNRLDQSVGTLWAHSDRLHKPYLPSGFTPYQVIGQICRLRDQGVALPDFKVRDAERFSPAEIKSLEDRMSELAERLSLAGVPARHPWRECATAPISPLDAERLAGVAEKLAASAHAVEAILRGVWPRIRGADDQQIDTLPVYALDSVVEALKIVSRKPTEAVDLLANLRWTMDMPALEALLNTAKKLSVAKGAVDRVFAPQAWQRNWESERAEISGSGRSIFRIFRSEYRAAIRTYRGACKGDLPSSHEERLASLDTLIDAQRLTIELQAQGAAFGPDLAAVFAELPDGWKRLEQLVAWLKEADSVRPLLSIRNTQILGWTEDCALWATRLSTIVERMCSALAEMVGSVALTNAAFSASDGKPTVTLGELIRRVDEWKIGVHRYNEWPPVRAGLEFLAEAIEGPLFASVYAGDVQPGDLANRVQLAVLEQIWKSMTSTEPTLATVDGRILDRKVTEFRELDSQRIGTAGHQIARKHYDEKPTGSVGAMGIIRGEINKSRRLLPVRRLIDQAGHAVQQLKPLFLMSPLSVAQYLSPGSIEFDLLLIDEASQVRPEDALGAVARTKQVVVVGDAKQLPPTSFFNRLVIEGDVADEDLYSDGSPAVGSMESILNLCDSTFTSRTMLEWHYRSQHPALIAVSNKRFYDNRLLLPPSVVKGTAADGLGVSFHKTPATGYDRGRTASNVVEADIVAEAVCAFARSQSEKSLGVGTFSVAQRDAIRERIDARRRKEPDLEPFFSANKSHPFFVKNLESIQGDERDVIFISVGYGRDSEGRLLQNFGPINNEGGERRLNVLISRARERCQVFSPITSDDIDTSSRKAGIVAFKEFLQFAEKGYFDIPLKTARAFDSDFEESVAEFLRGRGFRVDPQVGMSGFYIDLAVVDPKKESRYILGIECDGATYHSSRSARDRDRIRQNILESRGWTIYRIWSTDWFHRRAQAEASLLDAVSRAESGDFTKACHAVPSIQSTTPAPVGNIERASQPESPSAGSSSKEASVPYVWADFKVRSDVLPHEAPKTRVQEAVKRILDIEGPIHEEELGRRLAAVWGLERAGSRIQAAAKDALRALAHRNLACSKGPFWSAVESQLRHVRDRSQVESQTLRAAKHLPPDEIAFCILQVVRESVRVSESELVVEVARRFGFQRTGQDLSESVTAQIHSMKGTVLTIHADGSLSKSDN